MYEEMWGGPMSSTAAVMLARALVEQGRLDEAERFSRIGEETAAVDDVVTQVEWRYVRSKVFARQGDLAGGEALAREAVVLAERTDFLELHADALLGLAEVLALAGRADEGRPAIEQAIRLFERKGSVLGVERARALLSEAAREPLAELE